MLEAVSGQNEIKFRIRGVGRTDLEKVNRFEAFEIFRPSKAAVGMAVIGND